MKISEFISSKVMQNMDSDKKMFFRKVDGLFERVTNVSGLLRPKQEKQEKKDIIKNELIRI